MPQATSAQPQRVQRVALLRRRDAYRLVSLSFSLPFSPCCFLAGAFLTSPLLALLAFFSPIDRSTSFDPNLPQDSCHVPASAGLNTTGTADSDLHPPRLRKIGIRSFASGLRQLL